MTRERWEGRQDALKKYGIIFYIEADNYIVDALASIFIKHSYSVQPIGAQVVVHKLLQHLHTHSHPSYRLTVYP